MLIVCSGLISAAASAQKSEKNLYDFQTIKNTTGWLGSENASGLNSTPVEHVSYAQVSFDKTNGSFVNYHQSNDSYTITGKTESIYRLSPKTVVSGKVSYDYFTGNNMGGSSFIDPYFAPFDIVDSTWTNVGRKNQEVFNLFGAIGVKLTDKIHIGLKADYISSNYAKFKDLRHVNSLMDIDITAGGRFDVSDLFSVGINYHFRRRTESVSFDMYGTTDKRYYSIISYTNFYGTREEFGDFGYTDESNPIVTTLHGGDLQLNFDFSEDVSWFNELSFDSRKGYYGIPSAAKVVFTEDNGMYVRYKTSLNYKSGKNLHTIALNGGYTTLENYENVYKIVNNSGVTNTEYYGNRIVAEKSTIDATLKYTANLQMNGYTPKWAIDGILEAMIRNQEATIYPFFRSQDITTFGGFVSGKRNIIDNDNMYSISLGAGYGMGMGTKNEDGSLASVSGAKKPYSADYALNHEFEYLTAGRINAAIGFKYSKFFKSLTAYIGADYRLTNALGIEYLNGAMRHNAAVVIGCTF